MTFHNSVSINLLCRSLCLSSEHKSPKAERPSHWDSCWATGPQHLWRSPSLDPHERWVDVPSLSTQNSAAEHLTLERTLTLYETDSFKMITRNILMDHSYVGTYTTDQKFGVSKVFQCFLKNSFMLASRALCSLLFLGALALLI